MFCKKFVEMNFTIESYCKTQQSRKIKLSLYVYVCKNI